MLISIIVPVYNVEEYLVRCMESLLTQTYLDIEVILVNDGSTDSSGVLCEKYKLLDNRVRVIHKKNGGLSDARNVGLAEANGDYVFFVDSDDYLELDACENLCNKALQTNADIVIGKTNVIKGETRQILFHKISNIEETVSGVFFFRDQLSQNSMPMVVWNKLYKKDMLINNNITFKKGIYHEDEEWTPRVFLLNPTVSFIDKTIYNYVIRENSITQKKDKTKNGLDLLETCADLYNIYSKVEDDEFRRILYDRLATMYFMGITNAKFYKRVNRSKLNFEFLDQTCSSRKNKFKRLLLKVSPSLYPYSVKVYRVIGKKS